MIAAWLYGSTKAAGKVEGWNSSMRNDLRITVFLAALRSALIQAQQIFQHHYFNLHSFCHSITERIWAHGGNQTPSHRVSQKTWVEGDIKSDAVTLHCKKVLIRHLVSCYVLKSCFFCFFLSQNKWKNLLVGWDNPMCFRIFRGNK